MINQKLKKQVDNYLKNYAETTAPNVKSTINFAVETIQKCGNYNTHKLTDCYAYSADQVSQLSQLKDGSEPLKAYLINQAEMRNALMYKLSHDMKDLKVLGEDVVDEYKVLARSNIKRVRKSGLNSLTTSKKDRFA
ncbi:MAG: hypothetical protein D6B28_04560 [Gammaproteobacteria bacterium]|nr:MAG: hypothetical protein D6B28_04560 [Gammaproteobacteria bacterium]